LATSFCAFSIALARFSSSFLCTCHAIHTSISIRTEQFRYSTWLGVCYVGQWSYCSSGL
jgi:hypothetical protein